ncbi:monocarboxylate transporter 12-B-like [Mercenaria mercenaria]|uniref:monocarboxylate transporter 12-B-like n=1 Tax=Mercenaria mercenaria TaxID=6596 RepID=UPI00234E8384|nr:monocarboxylate transporter 12-B-like [Mercenaria mercenaria]
MTIDIAIEVSQSTSAGGGTRLSSATEMELDRYTEPVSPTAAVENKIEMEMKQQQDSERAVQTDESRVDEGLPIDKGWAWVVLAALITMTVGMKFMSNRMAVMLGAMILTISYIISAFATDVRMLFVSLGFLEGIGRALLHPTVMVSLVEYFNKRRGLANGLAFSGASFGGLIFAPVFAELFEKLGYSGTFLIVAGPVERAEYRQY